MGGNRTVQAEIRRELLADGWEEVVRSHDGKWFVRHPVGAWTFVKQWDPIAIFDSDDEALLWLQSITG